MGGRGNIYQPAFHLHGQPQQAHQQLGFPLPYGYQPYIPQQPPTQLPVPAPILHQAPAAQNVNAWRYGTLPATVNPRTWQLDFVAAMNRQGDKADAAKRGLAHAIMIDSHYGVVAQNPCKRCNSSSSTCRIYHPNMDTMAYKAVNSNRSMGKKCSGCRVGSGVKSSGCDAA
jgi:hypothetical protein